MKSSCAVKRFVLYCRDVNAGTGFGGTDGAAAYGGHLGGWAAAGVGGGGIGQDADDYAADRVHGGLRNPAVEYSGDHVYQ